MLCVLHLVDSSSCLGPLYGGNSFETSLCLTKGMLVEDLGLNDFLSFAICNGIWPGFVQSWLLWWNLHSNNQLPSLKKNPVCCSRINSQFIFSPT